jgi:GT2 family glycosyltransferase
VRGVTYGTFDGPARDGFPERATVAADLAAMVANGVNTVRTYTVPPSWLLDLAAEHGLRLLVGIPWEQHLAFLEDRRRCRSIVRSVRAAVRACARHPAVLGYVVGNEIPAGIVRWHGRQRVERFIERLYRAAKAEDPGALVTYANYPSTEFLHLPFLDLVCFNVFLEQESALERYLARLQTLAGDRPLVVSELGLDSRRHGLAAQARALAGQLRVAYGGGCAGCFVFAWTDEWNRGGHEVLDWDFGVVDRDREPKPALEAVRSAFADAPLVDAGRWPKVSVVVCTYNGASTIGECVRALLELDYPDYEVIVVDDGSTDGAGARARAYGARVINTQNQGLSAARNTGTATATGSVVAFCDDDCQPDPHWLRYLVSTLLVSGSAGVGGPNVPPPDRLVAESVGHAPGGPMHVLLADAEAEHIPGCNMAFHHSALARVGGFDPRFRVAGDDVDLCWRIRDAGGTLAFSPAALVWHRARGTVAAYLRQQAGYGRAEALLERKWPDRYNGNGHVSWTGTVYGGKVRRSFIRRRWRVYHGASGSGLFQSVYGGRGSRAPGFPLAPEWYLLLLGLATASACSLVAPWPLAAPALNVPLAPLLLAACLLALVVQAAAWTTAVVLPCSVARRRRLGMRSLIFTLCLLQPLARLWGRVHSGLTPWRRRGPRVLAAPLPRRTGFWSEHWSALESWVERLQAELRPSVAQVIRGGDFDTWDLDVRIGPLASGRVRMAVEEHGQGRQMVRLRIWPRCSPGAALTVVVLVVLAASAVAAHAAVAAILLGVASAWLVGATALQAAAAVALPVRAAVALQRTAGSQRASREAT